MATASRKVLNESTAPAAIVSAGHNLIGGDIAKRVAELGKLYREGLSTSKRAQFDAAILYRDTCKSGKIKDDVDTARAYAKLFAPDLIESSLKTLASQFRSFAAPGVAEVAGDYKAIEAAIPSDKKKDIFNAAYRVNAKLKKAAEDSKPVKSITPAFVSAALTVNRAPKVLSRKEKAEAAKKTLLEAIADFKHYLKSFKVTQKETAALTTLEAALTAE